MKITKKQFFQAVQTHGPSTSAIREGILNDYGVTIGGNNIRERIARARQSGSLPLQSGNSVQDGAVLKGTSTLYDKDGNVKVQWVKTDVAKEDELAAFKQAIDDFVGSPLIQASRTIAPPHAVDNDTMSIYSIGDAHIGLLAWGEETGEDYDSDIAVADLVSAIDLLVSQAHPSSEAFIVDVGDFYHSDTAANTTTAGTRVDVDTRFSKMIQTGLDLAVALVDRALQKHNTVHWRSAIGNHDSNTSLYVTSFLKAWYRNEPRVVIHDTPALFMYHQFGKNLIGITHGHRVKPEQLGNIMSVDCKEQWSSTDHRLFITGHIHHQQVKEFTNCTVESFNTLTGKDAWHAASGYRSKQSMKSITLHREYGEISRNTVNQALIRHHQSCK